MGIETLARVYAHALIKRDGLRQKVQDAADQLLLEAPMIVEGEMIEVPTMEIADISSEKMVASISNDTLVAECRRRGIEVVPGIDDELVPMHPPCNENG